MARSFGPKPRSYEYELPRKVKKAALRAALSLRASEQKIIVLDALRAPTARPSRSPTALAALGAGEQGADRRREDQRATSSAARSNLATSQWLAPEGLNVYDILRHETLVLTKDAVEADRRRRSKGKE